MAANDPTDLVSNPIPSNNLYVGAFNASVLDQLISAGAITVTNRTGATLKSYALLAQEIQTLVDDGQDVLDAFTISSNEALENFDEEAQEAIAALSAFSNTGDWVAETDYVKNELWQDPSTLTWYWVLNDYTSSTDIQDDIDSSNVVVFAGSTYNYNYAFVNQVLGDKIKLGSIFNDADTYDMLLGAVVEGTASAADIAVVSKVNAQLGAVFEG